SLTEEEFAGSLSARGTRVRRANGRFWRVDQGRYQPTHFFAQLAGTEMSRPAHDCWAYRAALNNGDASKANGAIPLHIIRDPGAYELGNLRSSKRRQIRASLNKLDYVEVIEPDLILQQGLGVLKSAVNRHGFGRLHTEGSYRKQIDSFFNPRRGLILGALRHDELVGYITMFAVQGVAYIDEVHLASDALDTHVGPGLTHHATQAGVRSQGITAIVHSLSVPERPGLTQFKEQMGFPVVEVPAFHWVAPGAKQMLRFLRPHGFYRFTGHQPEPGKAI
ncbi:MAG: hypothetical protein ACR2NL_09370, partial [Acidimicrobiia bacterium]